MRWSKLKSLIEQRFAKPLLKRVAIHSAAYGNCSCGHCWITLDKAVIANFCTRAYYNRALQGDSASYSMYKDHLVLYGEKSRQDAYQSMFNYIHTLTIDEALEAEDVLIQALAVIDARVGNKRVSALDKNKLHPLARKLLEIRRSQAISGRATR